MFDHGKSNVVKVTCDRESMDGYWFLINLLQCLINKIRRLNFLNQLCKVHEKSCFRLACCSHGLYCATQINTWHGFLNISR